MRTKPYHKRKIYKRKRGNFGTGKLRQKFMLPGNPPLKSLPTKDIVLAELFAMLPQMFQGFRGYHSKRR